MTTIDPFIVTIVVATVDTTIATTTVATTDTTNVTTDDTTTVVVFMRRMILRLVQLVCARKAARGGARSRFVWQKNGRIVVAGHNFQQACP